MPQPPADQAGGWNFWPFLNKRRCCLNRRRCRTLVDGGQALDARHEGNAPRFHCGGVLPRRPLHARGSSAVLRAFVFVPVDRVVARAARGAAAARASLGATTPHAGAHRLRRQGGRRRRRQRVGGRVAAVRRRRRLRARQRARQARRPRPVPLREEALRGQRRRCGRPERGRGGEPLRAPLLLPPRRRATRRARAWIPPLVRGGVAHDDTPPLRTAPRACAYLRLRAARSVVRTAAAQRRRAEEIAAVACVLRTVVVARPPPLPPPRTGLCCSF